MLDNMNMLDIWLGSINRYMHIMDNECRNYYNKIV
jgi:hypothetical protein